MALSISTIIDELEKDIKSRPEEFSISDDRLLDTTKMIIYNISGAWFECGTVEPFKLSFGWYNGWRFKRLIKQYKIWRALNGYDTSKNYKR